MHRRLVPLLVALLAAMLAVAPAAHADPGEIVEVELLTDASATLADDVPQESNMDYGPLATQDPAVATTDEGCGTNRVWQRTTAAGNYYHIRGWICNRDEGAYGRAVAWWRIYRNGVQWETGFRGDGQLRLLTIATGCTKPCVDAVKPHFWCYTCSGPYVGYTGRQYGNLWNSPGSTMLAATSYTRFRVRFANGTIILYDDIRELAANQSTI
jgi:hypothetical protein